MGVLLTAARLAGVATRIVVRYLDRGARREALQSVTGGITMADILVVTTMTREDVVADQVLAALPELPVVTGPVEGSTLSVVGTSAVVFVACVLVGCCLAVDTSDGGRARNKSVASKRHMEIPCPAARRR